MVGLTLIISFIAGVVSFSSPCVLPFVPGLLAYLAGTSITESRFRRREVLVNATLFVLGLSLVFAILGLILNSLLAGIGFTAQVWLARIGGCVIIFFGLNLAGLIQVPFTGRRCGIMSSSSHTPHYFRSFALGSAFAAGWTPCVGSVLGVVLGMAATEPASAFPLLLAYSLGLGVPFLFVGSFAAQALTLFSGNHTKMLSHLRSGLGVVMIILGILVFTQNLGLLSLPTVIYS